MMNWKNPRRRESKKTDGPLSGESLRSKIVLIVIGALFATASSVGATLFTLNYEAPRKEAERLEARVIDAQKRDEEAMSEEIKRDWTAFENISATVEGEFAALSYLLGEVALMSRPPLKQTPYISDDFEKAIADLHKRRRPSNELPLRVIAMERSFGMGDRQSNLESALFNMLQLNIMVLGASRFAGKGFDEAQDVSLFVVRNDDPSQADSTAFSGSAAIERVRLQFASVHDEWRRVSSEMIKKIEQKKERLRGLRWRVHPNGFKEASRPQ